MRKLFWNSLCVKILLEDTFLWQQNVHESGILVEQPVKFRTNYIEVIKILT
jgi:hypothetical protein